MTIEIGDFCSAPFMGNDSPAIYLGQLKGKPLVYLRHLDKAERVNDVKDFEPTEIREQITQMEYGLMECPAFFRLGTSLLIKWGNSSYYVNSGNRADIKSDTMVDKITATLVV